MWFQQRLMNSIKIFLKKKKNKKRQYGRDRYRYLTEDEKQRLAEYRKNYSKMENKAWLILLLVITDRCIKKSKIKKNLLL